VGRDVGAGSLTDLKRLALLVVVLAFAVVVGLGLYADFDDLGEALGEFQWALFPLALALTFVNYLVRFWRWQVYLRRLAIDVPANRSFWIYFAGQTMTLSPAKVGEVLKSVLLKRSFGVPIQRSAPIVLVERITDGLGVVIIAAVAGGVAAGAWEVIVATVGGAAALVLAVKLPFADRFPPLAEARAAASELLGPGLLAGMTLVSACAWFFECLASYVCVRGLGLDVSLADVSLAFSVAGLAGAISFVPGGLGVTEAGFTGLLRVLADVPRAEAAAATVLTRLATLWFAVALGLVALVVDQRAYRRSQAQPFDSAVPGPARRSSMR
jgi:uncharacterized membrane protein YbhN (UPF0104 family)